MNYRIHLKKSHDILERFLQFYDLKTETHETFMDIEVDEINYLSMIKSIAIFIVQEAYITTVQSTLYVKGTSKEVQDEILIELMEEMSLYEVQLTMVHLMESFKKKPEVNLEALRVFQLKGIREDIKKIVEEKLEARNVMEDEFATDMLNESGIEEMIEEFHEDAKEMGVPFDEFRQVKLVFKNNAFEFYKNTGERLDHEYLLDLIQANVIIRLADDMENKELCESLIFFEILSKVLQIKEINVATKIPNEALNLLKLVLGELSTRGIQITLIDNINE